MNLLKQTALVLGLVSLSIGSWTLYRNWRQKIAIFFSVLCFCVAIWALSFVAYVTLGGRFSKDVHWFMNIWISPIGVSLLAQILSNEDVISRLLSWVSFAGAVILGTMITFSMGSSPLFWALVAFWPTFVVIQYFNVMIKHLISGKAVSIDFISSRKIKGFYLGLGACFLFCSFDHIPFLGYFIPSIGNLIFAVFLGFASQVISPQKVLGMEALISRFFATLILSLVITGFFALMFQYVSTTFPLFFLNSFLISFAVLVLWNPLITFFRFLGREIFRSESEMRKQQIDQFRLALLAVTDMESLMELIKKSFKLWMEASTRLVFDQKTLQLPLAVDSFFQSHRSKHETPILHRDLIQLEKDQVITAERKQELNLLIQFLDVHQSDIVFPVFQQTHVIALVFVSAHTFVDEWSVSIGFYSKIFESLQEVGPTLLRLTQIQEAKEKDRLILMGEMAAGLAHEIRNPLSAIRGAAELIDENSGPWAKVIQEEVSRLNRLVSQFLDFAYSPKDFPEKANLNHLVQTTLKAHRHSIPEMVDLQFYSKQEEIWVMIVPDHLQQILINLIQNALKAVQTCSKPRIEVEVFEFGFKVKDNGVGMDADTQSKIFHPFFTTFSDGSGLGLSICQRLIKFNAGKIEVRSTLGVGTEVIVEVPRA